MMFSFSQGALRRSATAVFLMAAVHGTDAAAADFRHEPASKKDTPGHLVLGEKATPITSYIRDFCVSNPADCAYTSNNPKRIVYDRAARAAIHRVNNEVNATLIPTNDWEQYGHQERFAGFRPADIDVWEYPVNGKGDCEEYVLEKRRRLAALGFDLSALLVTVVLDENENGHAILTVRTDKGDMLLDNRRSAIRSQREAVDYTFLKMLDPRDFSRFVTVTQTPPMVADRREEGRTTMGLIP